MKITTLPKELKNIVGLVLDRLGDAIEIEYGKKTFHLVEQTRKDYSLLRKKTDAKLLEQHISLRKDLLKLSPLQRQQVAHSFATSLELINACENAYRNHRLEVKKGTIPHTGDPIVFVLTAHPTEARSPEAIDLLGEITDNIERYLTQSQPEHSFKVNLKFLIQMFLKIPMAKSKKPSVEDEAEYVYKSIFQPEILEELLYLYESGSPCWIRSWVGGDKDGHPGVDERVMINSLELSRKFLLESIDQQFSLSQKMLGLIQSSRPTEVSLILNELQSLRRKIRSFRKIDSNDYLKIVESRKDLKKLESSYFKTTKVSCPHLSFIESTWKLFPGLVVPLELREDSELVHEALKDDKLAIYKMLLKLKDISGGKHASLYVRGMVLSMCEAFADYNAGCKLVKKILGQHHIPVIPLFETKQALISSQSICEEILDDTGIRKSLSSLWSNKMEIMLGYSDSAKESGAFYSRFMIQSTLHKLDGLFKKEKITPIYFHGSGGSVARGGGSIEEQVSWWPKTAQRRFKATIQGEMIYRTFSSPQLLSRKVEKIRLAYLAKPVKAEKPADTKVLQNFADLVRDQYSQKVIDDNFLEIVEKATPYPYLDQLRIGSRPSKRSGGKLSLKSLRAIPWVLCWTQTRTLFPVWWGIGTTWSELNINQQKDLAQAFKNSSLASSFVKTLSYALAKVDLSVWDYYLDSSSLSEKLKSSASKEFKKELKLCRSFLKEIGGKSEAFKIHDWLDESIELRSTFIYPLNVLEVIALESKESDLLRESVTGIASGMLTTG